MLMVVLVLSVFLVGCGTCPEIPEYDCPDVTVSCPPYECPDVSCTPNVSCPAYPVDELKLPEIVLFEGTRTAPAILTLSWVVVGADVGYISRTCSIAPLLPCEDIGYVTSIAKGEVIVNLAFGTTTFTLTATNLDGVSTASVTITELP